MVDTRMEALPVLEGLETVSANPAVGPLAERDRGIFHATWFLAAMSALALLVLLYEGLSAHAFWIFLSVPLLMGLSHLLVRAGYTLPAATAAITTACASAMMVAAYAPHWTPLASTFLLMTAVLILASQVMTFEIAGGLTSANVILAVALPSFLPIASAGAVQIPYLFILVNAMFILFAALLRMHDREQLQQVQQEAERLERAFAEAELEAERKRREQAKHVKRVEAMARKQRHMLDTATHEIKTPLTPLLMQVAAYKRKYDGQLSEDQARSVELLERNLKRMASLIGDLLDMARMNNDRMELVLAPTPVATLLEDARATFEWQAAEKLVEVRLEAEDLICELDATRIGQVVHNLLSNAIKYAPRSSEVRVCARAAKGGIEITVQDAGIGLTEEQRKALFQPFSQVHDSDKKTGTGLGLYISRAIIDRHGGRMWVNSDGRGEGATFGFWVPAPMLGHEALSGMVN